MGMGMGMDGGVASFGIELHSFGVVSASFEIVSCLLFSRNGPPSPVFVSLPAENKHLRISGIKCHNMAVAVSFHRKNMLNSMRSKNCDLHRRRSQLHPAS